MTVYVFFADVVKTIEAKRIDVSYNGLFVKIEDFDGNSWETSPSNVLIFT